MGKGQRCHILASVVQGPAKQHFEITCSYSLSEKWRLSLPGSLPLFNLIVLKDIFNLTFQAEICFFLMKAKTQHNVTMRFVVPRNAVVRVCSTTFVGVYLCVVNNSPQFFCYLHESWMVSRYPRESRTTGEKEKLWEVFLSKNSRMTQDQSISLVFPISSSNFSPCFQQTLHLLCAAAQWWGAGLKGEMLPAWNCAMGKVGKGKV